jgi:selenocysteine-specific elongation factor
VATAGHVDHGKSALVRALTGIEPDRWEEERRRGMTIGLGFAWTTLSSGADVAFVDVPGHDRFVPTMLSGVGPVPAVLLVVAADEGWSAQTEEHVGALNALGTTHCLVAVTKSDLGSPEPVAADVLDRLRATSLAAQGQPPWVGVSAKEGRGLEELRLALDRLLDGISEAPTDGPVRLWIDRAFSVTGAGTVVTGTLTSGTLAVGDGLVVAATGRPVTVRALHSENRRVEQVTPVRRVAVNLRGVTAPELRRGVALMTPGWLTPDTVDVTAAHPLPDWVASGAVTAHVGAASVVAHGRRLGDRAVRLALPGGLPLRVTDRLLLRDPGRRAVVGVDVVDVMPDPHRRRGDAARTAATLSAGPDPDLVVDRRGAVSAATLRAAGYRRDPVRAALIGEWWCGTEQLAAWAAALARVVSASPAGTVPEETARQQLGIPDHAVLAVVAARSGQPIGRGVIGRHDGAESPALQALVQRLGADPLDVPDGEALAGLGLSAAELSRACTDGRLVSLARGVYAGPAVIDRAVAVLAGLPSPFTTSQARQALGISRRVVVPLLEFLDRQHLTRRDPEDRRALRSSVVTSD